MKQKNNSPKVNKAMIVIYLLLFAFFTAWGFIYKDDFLIAIFLAVISIVGAFKFFRKL